MIGLGIVWNLVEILEVGACCRLLGSYQINLEGWTAIVQPPGVKSGNELKMKNGKCEMRGSEVGGFGFGVRAHVESVSGAPTRRGNFSLGGAAARALPLPQLRKSLRRMAGRALSGFVGPLNFKKVASRHGPSGARLARTLAPPRDQWGAVLRQYPPISVNIRP